MRRISHFAIALAVLLAGGGTAFAQSEESLPPPAPGTFEAAPASPPATPFVVPEVPPRMLRNLSFSNDTFSLKPGLVLLADYTAFGQDETSIAQVGKQDDRWQARAARLMFSGTVGRSYKVNYLVAGEYKGFESDPETTWNVTDVSVTFPLGGPATKLTVGKTKETFGYEMVGDAASLPHQERVLTPFFVSRNVGAKVVRVMANQRVTIAGGVFNDWWVHGDSLSDSGTDVTARVTGLAVDARDGKRFLHLGAAARYAGADNDTMRYRGRPESNVSDYFVDTGSLAGDHAWHTGIEGLWNEGPVSVLGEFMRARVSSTASGNPTFSGYYFTGSWVVSGETRPYDRTQGYARRVMPAGRWGAPEIVVRFSHEDLDDALVKGGTFDKTYLGINWWATRRWKFGAGWNHTWLDRFGTTGVTDAVLTRIQWIY